MNKLPIGNTVNKEKLILFKWLQRFGSRFKTGFIITDPKNEEDPIVFVNNSFTEITGYHSDEVLGKSFQFLFGKETDMDLIRKVDNLLREAEPISEEFLYYKKDGTPFWSELVIQPLVNTDGETLLTIGLMRDVSDQKKDEMLLILQERILTGINKGVEFEEIMCNVFEVVESFLLTGVACLSIFKDGNGKWSVQSDDSIPKEMIVNVQEDIKKDGDRLRENDFIVEEIQKCAEHDFRASWSVPMFNSDRSLNGVFIVFKKITDDPTEIQKRYLHELVPVLQMTKTFFEQQKQYRELAFLDQGTKLPNSHAFLRQLKMEKETGGKRFVAIIRPSEYSRIIDLYGRGAADGLFIQLARRIETEGLGKKEFIARFSSSSLIITDKIPNRDDGDLYLLKLKEIVSEPFIISGEEMFITLKVGIVLFAGRNICEEELVRRADVALTEAYRRPGNSTSYYRDMQNERNVQDMTIFNELTKALSTDEIEVHLQPKVNLENGEIIGFEALARWTSPVLGQVSPNVFIPVAESIGKIIELEKVILEIVIKWQEKRKRSGERMYQVAVNISVDHFFHHCFIKTLKTLCEKYNVSSKYIRLEIIESIGLVDFEKAKVIFNELRAASFDVSIDDFGVGFSSLSYLPQLNVNELKIDRSFIRALDEPDTHAVVMTIIQLANNLNLSTVAEGIEEERHIQMLLTLGCKIGQGFYFYKPMPLSEIDLLLQQQ